MPTHKRRAPWIIGFLCGDWWRHRPGLLPAPQAPELRIERQHVGERGGSGAGQSVDVDRTADGDILDVGVVRVPRLDLEAVDEPAAQVVYHRRVGVAIQVTVALEAVEKYLQALAEVAGPEVLVAAFGNCLLQQPISGGIAHAPHRSFTRSG